MLQHSCKVTIEYEDSIRSIDLENLLSGIRMICQHEMSVKFGGTPRDYTDCTKIQSIENGSIEINMLFDLVHINIDLIEVNLNLLSVDIDFDFKDLTRFHWFQLLRGKKPVDMTDRAFESFKQWAMAEGWLHGHGNFVYEGRKARGLEPQEIHTQLFND